MSETENKPIIAEVEFLRAAAGALLQAGLELAALAEMDSEADQPGTDLYAALSRWGDAVAYANSGEWPKHYGNQVSENE